MEYSIKTLLNPEKKYPKIAKEYHCLNQGIKRPKPR